MMMDGRRRVKKTIIPTKGETCVNTAGANSATAISMAVAAER
jgi:hypothetical protein